MVHRKSEYRLQYHIFGKDLRTKIWQDNIKFRETCRMLNQADHYWTYQLTDEKCECEKDEEEEEEDEATLPEHKLKHKQLLAKYGSSKSVGETNNLPRQEMPTQSSVEATQQMQPQEVEKQISDEKSTAIQWTPHLDQQELRVKEDSQNGKQDLNATVSQPLVDHQINARKELDFSSHFKHHEPETLSPKSILKNSQRSASSAGQQPTMVSSRTSSPTKTSRKAYFEDRKSPFAPYGWNDSDRDLGQKKTYNVYAPESEVYTPALLALKRRREAMEKYLAEQAEKRQELGSSSTGVVNHSSIWMSEYQDRFSHGTRIFPHIVYGRPSSSTCCHRHAGWRYS